jgi:hypothetical protein
LSSSICIEKTKRSGGYNCVPGWNSYVKDKHDRARWAYMLWRDNGKPRQGAIHILLRYSRAQFKYALVNVKHQRSR